MEGKQSEINPMIQNCQETNRVNRLESMRSMKSIRSVRSVRSVRSLTPMDQNNENIASDIKNNDNYINHKYKKSSLFREELQNAALINNQLLTNLSYSL